jgi:hypothetical protein
VRISRSAAGLNPRPPLFQMALCFQFTPRQGLGVEAYQILKCFGDDMGALERQSKLSSLANSYFHSLIEADDIRHSLEIVQTALSMLLYDQLNMHHIQQPFHPSEEGYREEAMVRCWWVAMQSRV